jgi:hypothetical protein
MAEFIPPKRNSSGYATQVGIVPSEKTTLKAPSATAGQAGGPNLFANPALAFAAYAQTPAGRPGNGTEFAERAHSVLTWDSRSGSTYLTSTISHTRSRSGRRVSNVTNTVRFDSANLNISNRNTFGKYTSTLGSPRVFQFSARYEF